jgi:hypothetical protein
MNPLLDNILWRALDGPHRRFSAGNDRARRYAKGISPIVGFPEREQPDFAALAPWCERGEHFYCEGWPGTVPADWQVEHETTMYRMVWAGGSSPWLASACMPAPCAR